MRLRIKNTSLTLQIIGWLQIVGGLTGLWLMATLMLQTGTINGALLLIFIIGLGLFSYSIYSGKRLLTDQEKRTAIILSMINQVAQVLQWSAFGYALSYSSGGELTFGIEGFGVKFHFSAIVSTFKMAINSDDAFFLKINLIPVFVIVVLADIFKELKQDRGRQYAEVVEAPNEGIRKE